jgi:hypothetical protein
MVIGVWGGQCMVFCKRSLEALWRSHTSGAGLAEMLFPRGHCNKRNVFQTNLAGA